MQAIRTVHQVTGPTLTIAVPDDFAGRQVEVIIQPLAASAQGKEPIQAVEIVERGRGPQLSTCRITVQDVLPYLQKGSSYDDIRRAMPLLRVEDIQAIERYIAEHRDEVMAEDRRIREENASRRNPPEVEKVLAEAHAQRLARLAARQRSQEVSGEGHSG